MPAVGARREADPAVQAARDKVVSLVAQSEARLAERQRKIEQHARESEASSAELGRSLEEAARLLEGIKDPDTAGAVAEQLVSCLRGRARTEARACDPPGHIHRPPLRAQGLADACNHPGLVADLQMLEKHQARTRKAEAAANEVRAALASDVKALGVSHPKVQSMLAKHAGARQALEEMGVVGEVASSSAVSAGDERT